MKKTIRRVIAATLLLCVLFAVVFPLAAPALGHSAHNCRHENCRVCALLALTGSLLRQLFAVFVFLTALRLLSLRRSDIRALRRFCAAPRSLISDKVRANA